jgi:hypothetical protein
LPLSTLFSSLFFLTVKEEEQKEKKDLAGKHRRVQRKLQETYFKSKASLSPVPPTA